MLYVIIKNVRRVIGVIIITAMKVLIDVMGDVEDMMVLVVIENN